MRLANFFVSLGEIDDMSTNDLPSREPRRDAAVSEERRRDVRRVGTIVMMTSLFSATSLLDLQATAPAFVSSAGMGPMS